jgi:predicted ATPase
MILDIHIKGFKRFADERLALGPLTVLTGLNGSGKSSLIQSIFLAREAATGRGSSLRLNGPFGLQLGTAVDVLNWVSEGPIEVTINDTVGGAAFWRFGIPGEDALYLDILASPETLPPAFRPIPRAFTFLSAERLGPRGASITSAVPDFDLEVGREGEYCAHVLSVIGDRLPLHVERAHPLHDDPSPRLLKYEVEQWLSELSQPIEVTGERLQGSTVAELRYRLPGGTWVRSTNMGFGLTYALPIILGGLIAEPGGLVIVENPEAHLHPAGQSRMGVFLAWLAGHGVQVIVETHSDHVLNGMRRAVAEHRYIDANSVAVHYFGGSIADSHGRVFEPLSFTAGGSLSAWPSGFFDQYQIDVASLGQVRRRRD